MADEAISARSNTVLVAPGVPGWKAAVTVGDADEKPGHVVTGTGETHPDVDLCAAGESIAGVLLERSDLDIDTAFSAANGADGVDMARYRSGARVWGFMMATGATCVAGAPLTVASEAGKWTFLDSDVTATVNQANVNAALDIINAGSARLCEDYTQDNSDDQVVEVLL